MLAAAKFILPADRALRQNDWRPRYQPLPAVSLNGKNALILGFGAVGQRVGLVCHALGMQIRAIRRNPQKPVFNSYPVEIGGPDALPAWIPSADVLLITLPATPQTENLIGEKEIRRLPGGAILVNVGRGAIVDQHALYVALKDGHLRAAGLDVWYNYPQQETDRANTPPAEFPFHELDNVVMSPHRAGASVDTEILRMTHLANLLNTIAEGKPVPNRVDLEAGY
jgi:phosphoglycerate dehydrogenase-like enzyme